MSKIKIYLVSIYRDSFINSARLTLGYLKSYLKKDCYLNKKLNVQLLFISDRHSSYRINNLIIYKISKELPKIVCFSVYMWNIHKTLEIISLIKQVKPDILVIVGGPQFSELNAEIYLRNSAIDFIVCGEGEITLYELIRAIIENDNLNSIKGISYRYKGEGEITHNENREEINNLDIIPSPYLNSIIPPGDCIETSRGCPFKCSYCTEGIKKSYRHFSLDRVKADIDFLDSKEIRKLYVFDGSFNIKTDFSIAVCDHIASKSNIKQIFVDVNLELITEEVIRYFKKAGAWIEIGLQSIFPDTLTNVNRTFNKSKFLENIELLKKYEIPFVVDVISGLPGDNFLRLLASIKFSIRLKPMRFIVNQLYILPGTQLEKEIDKFNIIFSPDSFIQYSNQTWSARENLLSTVASSTILSEYLLDARLNNC